MPGTTAAMQEQLKARLVGGIPVRNLWLLLLYASELFNHCVNSRVSIEDNPDEIPDLVAEILAYRTEQRLRKNLTCAYQGYEADLTRMRGRIDLLRTERHQLQIRGMIACRYEELTVNTCRNRFVLAALGSIVSIIRRQDLARRCRALRDDLKQLDVADEKPSRFEMSIEHFGRNDADDRYMLEAAKLAFDLALPTEEAGNGFLAIPDQEISWVRRLYERAVGGFYKVVLSPRGWNVSLGRPLDWLVEQKTAGIDRLLPSMRTDVILEHAKTKKYIVIDTKFTSIIKPGWHRDETLSSGYLYQIYAYLRSQEGNSGSPFATHSSGLLLHPAIGETVDETVVIQGHKIRFATVDLAAPAKEIRQRLLEFVA